MANQRYGAGASIQYTKGAQPPSKAGGQPLPAKVAQLQTGKARASRISLDYYKSLNRLEKAKLVLTLVAILGAGAWLAWGAISSSGSTRFARGPVAAVHAANENDCQSCHVSFAPMSESNLFMKHPSKADEKCLACHSADEHHKSASPEFTASCAGCHHEHQGRDFSLVRVPDPDCISCHKDLKGHMQGGEAPVFANAVSTFAEHPDFGTYIAGGLKDPGKLHFNHKLHLAAGKGIATTLRAVKQADEATYTRFKNADWQKDKSDDAVVQLDCASCHTTKSGGHGDAKVAGRYMQPINYDTNCKACHQLTFDSNVKDRDGKIYALPHGKPFAEIEDTLRREYTIAIARSPNDFREKQPTAGLRPLPGKMPYEFDPTPVKLEGDALIKRAAALASEKAKLLQGSACAECHTIENKTIVKVNVPQVWFKHAKFSHASHELMKCVDCHGGAPDSIVNTDVLLPKVKKCQECHSPARTEDGKPAGGVRYECTTCHTYHHGDQPLLQALGTLHGDPRLALDWQSLMREKQRK